MARALELPLQAEDYYPTHVGTYIPALPFKLWLVADELWDSLLEQSNDLLKAYLEVSGKNSSFELLMDANNALYRGVDDLLLYHKSEGDLAALWASYENAFETFLVSGQCSLKLAKLLNLSRGKALLSLDELLSTFRAYGATGSYVFTHCTQLLLRLSGEEPQNIHHSSLDLFMRGSFESGVVLERKQRQQFLDYIHLRNALLEEPEANLSAYVAAAKLLEAGHSEGLSELEAFEDHFWVNRAWVRETGVSS